MDVSSEVRTHFGVYGVCTSRNGLLCIKKNVGPYKNRYDIPGGSQNDWEGLTETLYREILEETGYVVKKQCNSRVYDAFIKEKEYTVHHIMVFYDIELDSGKSQELLPELLADGLNDSKEAIWKSFEDLNENNSSPLILQIKKEFLETAVLEKSIYSDWLVK